MEHNKEVLTSKLWKLYHCFSLSSLLFVFAILSIFICSSLGKPRRFSDHFLAAEKDKLENYRKKVRQYYALLSEDSWDSLPPDLARPFSIGQQVIVRHPSTRELCDGKVVMMEQDRYNVQFDRPDLGVDEVKVHLFNISCIS